jgi:hypothetical protein
MEIHHPLGRSWCQDKRYNNNNNNNKGDNLGSRVIETLSVMCKITAKPLS